MNSITVSNDKTLKLTDVVAVPLGENHFTDLAKIVEKLDNQIRIRGCQSFGPLIQHTIPHVNDDGTIEVENIFLRQSSNYIHHLDSPYTIESVLRVKDCMYARYTGTETKIKMGVDKINVTAFEEGIELQGDSYIIYVNQIDDDVVVDIFMPKKQA